MGNAFRSVWNDLTWLFSVTSLLITEDTVIELDLICAQMLFLKTKKSKEITMFEPETVQNGSLYKTCITQLLYLHLICRYLCCN